MPPSWGSGEDGTVSFERRKPAPHMLSFPDPLRVAVGTFLIRPLVRPPEADASIHVSSLVIVGTEPVLVDTGPALARDEWCEQVFGLVEPDDVRWVFLSHDDADHTGNLPAVLAACPNATVVANRPGAPDERAGGAAGRSRRSLAPGRDHGGEAPARLDGPLTSGVLDVPQARRRWIEGSFDAGDRRLVAVRPPIFDAPSTRGLLDPTTGVYWAGDAFGMMLTEVVDYVDERPAHEWLEQLTRFASSVSPRLPAAQPRSDGRCVQRVAELDAKVLVGAHGPVITGPSIDLALDALRRLPNAGDHRPGGHGLLEETLAALAPA